MDSYSRLQRLSQQSESHARAARSLKVPQAVSSRLQSRPRSLLIRATRLRTATTPRSVYTPQYYSRGRGDAARRGGRAPAPGARARRAPAAPARPPSPGTNRIDRPRLTSPVGRLEALRAAPGSRAAPVRSLRRGLLRHGRRDAPRYALRQPAARLPTAKLSPCV